MARLTFDKELLVSG